ncbi:MAG: hypothetical protein MJZ23_08170 [Paludibacteraceae bacterium]|nr:hypothetical protein [Paludibacteraceae bacterium]
MAKYTYSVIVNDVDSDNKPFRYTYSKMEMLVLVAKDSFIVMYETNTEKTPDQIWMSREVEDGVRKALLAQLIFFGHNCEFKKVLIKEANSDEYKIIDEPRVYNLIPSDVYVDLSPLRDNMFVTEYLMKRVKSKYESGIAALFSYIYAKSKKCEEDKFTYFWRSFNGIYSSVAKESVVDGSFDKAKVKKENEVLKNWLRNRETQNFMVASLFNKAYAVNNDYTIAEKKIKHFFYTVRDKAAKANWTKDDIRNALNARGNKNVNLANVLGLQNYVYSVNPDMMVVEIEGQPKISKSSLYGYLMTELAYQIRCSYFHAAKPILLHTTLSDPEFRGLQLANALLEHYLDENIKDEVMEKIKLEKMLEERQK